MLKLMTLYTVNASPCGLDRDDESNIYQKNIFILLVDDVTLTAYKVMSFIQHQINPYELRH